MKVERNIIVQYLLGVVFITSGVTKLLSFDEFQVFIYSLNIINLNLSLILTRIIIGIELSIGLLYLFRIYPKLVSYATLILMFFFTIFAIYLELKSYTDDCHCFGSFIQISNTTTILKNIIIIFFVVYSLIYSTQKKYKQKNLIVICSLILGFGSTIVVRLPDLMLSKEIHPETYYYKPSFDKFIEKNELTDKKLIICFLSSKCKYCKLTAKRISVISEKTNNTDDILYVFWKKDNDTIDFFNETKTRRFNFLTINVIEFLKITNGTMPLTIIYNNRKVENAFRYKDFNESQTIKFLQK